jgi:hypothetical protein
MISGPQFKTNAVVKFYVGTGLSWGVPYCNLKFMAELTLTAIANVDLLFTFAFAYNWTPDPVKIASITPMLDQALAGFSILGFPLTLGVSYGIDIKWGTAASALVFTNLLTLLMQRWCCNRCQTQLALDSRLRCPVQLQIWDLLWVLAASSRLRCRSMCCLMFSIFWHSLSSVCVTPLQLSHSTSHGRRLQPIVSSARRQRQRLAGCHSLP